MAPSTVGAHGRLRAAIIVACIADTVGVSLWSCTTGQTPDTTLPIQAMACGSGSRNPNCHNPSSSKGFGFYTLNIGESVV